jgi:hypothetical protein
MNACDKGLEATAALLIEKSADVNAVNKVSSPSGCQGPFVRVSGSGSVPRFQGVRVSVLGGRVRASGIEGQGVRESGSQNMGIRVRVRVRVRVSGSGSGCQGQFVRGSVSEFVAWGQCQGIRVRVERSESVSGGQGVRVKVERCQIKGQEVRVSRSKVRVRMS